jgi:hypothetical protein
VCQGDVVANGHKTERDFGIHGINTVQMVHPVCQGFDGAEIPRSGSVIHGAPTLTILLVIQVQADAFATKLNGAHRFVGGRHCIFTWMEEKEKGNDDEVRNGRPKGWPLLAIVPNNNLDGPNGQSELRLWRWILVFV